MSPWPTSNLGDVCEVVSGATPKTTNPDFWDGDVLWVTPKDLTIIGQKYINDTPRKITELGLKSCSATMLPANSVLFSSRAPIGLVAINTVPVCTNQGFKSLVPRDELVYADYIYWWLETYRKSIQKKGRGATFKELSKKLVEELKIPLPPLDEQKRIAAILNAAEDLRAKRRKSLAELDALLQSTFLDMFGDPVTNPMGWEVVSVGSISERVTKGESPKWQGFEYQNDGALFITSENVRDNSIDLSRPKFVPLEFNDKLSRSELLKNDLLINLVGASIGRSCLFPGYIRPANVNQAVCVVTLGERIDAKYLVNLLASEMGQKLLLGNRVEAARANISLKNIRELQIPLPPLDVQQRFVAITNSVEGQKFRQRAHLNELDTLFASLQYRAFKGEL